MSTTDTITIRFKNTFSDHLHASRTYEKTTFFHKTDKLVAVLLLLFGCWLVYVDSWLRWTHYNKVVESSRVFLLIYGKWAYSMIPKSAFSNEGQANAFRDLCRRKVESYAQVRRSV